MRRLLLLFDLDGTLLRSAGFGQAALDQTFADLFGWEDATAGLDFGGATDAWIRRAGPCLRSGIVSEQRIVSAGHASSFSTAEPRRSAKGASSVVWIIKLVNLVVRDGANDCAKSMGAAGVRLVSYRLAGRIST